MVNSQETRHFHAASTRQPHHPDRRSNATIVPGSDGSYLPLIECKGDAAACIRALRNFRSIRYRETLGWIAAQESCPGIWAVESKYGVGTDAEAYHTSRLSAAQGCGGIAQISGRCRATHRHASAPGRICRASIFPNRVLRWMPNILAASVWFQRVFSSARKM